VKYSHVDNTQRMSLPSSHNDDVKTKSSFRIFCNLFIAFIGAGILGLPFAFKEAGIVEGCIIMLSVGFISSKAMILLINCKEKIVSSPEFNASPRKVSTSTDDPLSSTAVKTGSPFKKLTDLIKPPTLPSEDNERLLSSDEVVEVKPGSINRVSKTIMYGDVGFYALGTLGKMLVEIALVISQAGFCCSYLIFISETVSSMAPLTRIQILLLSMPILMAMSLMKDLHSMAVFSFFAQFANLSAFAVVFWFDFEHYGTVKVQPKTSSITSIPFFMAVGIYCYEGAGMILSIEDSVALSHRIKFRRIFVVAMVVVTFLYVSFGAAGYLSFGSETSPIITTNLPHGTGSSVDFAVVVKLLLCIALLFTYPVMLFPVIKLVEANMEDRINSLLSRFFSATKTSALSHTLVRISLVLLTNVVVLLIPNFANLMALVGASCCTLLAFILPGIFHYQLFRNSGLARSQVMFDVFLIILGIVGASLGTADALNRIRKPLPTPRPESSSPSENSLVSNSRLTTLSSFSLSKSKIDVNVPTLPTDTVMDTLITTVSTVLRDMFS